MEEKKYLLTKHGHASVVTAWDIKAITGCKDVDKAIKMLGDKIAPICSDKKHEEKSNRW